MTQSPENAASTAPTKSAKPSSVPKPQASQSPSTSPGTQRASGQPTATSAVALAPSRQQGNSTPVAGDANAAREVFNAAQAARNKEARDTAHPRREPLSRVPTGSEDRLAAAMQGRKVSELEATRESAQEQPDAAQAVEGGTDEAQSNEWKNVREALHRTGLYSYDAIDAMDVDEAKRLAKKARRIQSRSSAREQESRAKDAEIARLKAQLKTGQVTSEGSSSAHQSRSPALDSNPDELAKLLSSYADDPVEGAKQVATVISDLVAEVRALKLAPQGDSPANAAAAQAKVTSDVRAELSERFPDLIDDDDFQEVQDEMTRLSNLRQFAALEPGREKTALLMERACRVFDLEEVAGRSDPERQLRRAGSPFVPRSNERPRLTSGDPKQDARAQFEERQALRAAQPRAVVGRR